MCFYPGFCRFNGATTGSIHGSGEDNDFHMSIIKYSLKTRHILCI